MEIESIEDIDRFDWYLTGMTLSGSFTPQEVILDKTGLKIKISIPFLENVYNLYDSCISKGNGLQSSNRPTVEIFCKLPDPCNEDIAYNVKDKLMLLFHLFLPSSVESWLSALYRAGQKSYSIVQTTPGNHNCSVFPDYFLDEGNFTRLRAFMEKLYPAIPDKMVDRNSHPNKLYVATQRYEDFLLHESHKFESGVMHAVMGLEALYIDDDKELNYRLANRVGKFFSFFGKSAIDIRNLVKCAYSIRSKYAHGSPADENVETRIIKEFGSTRGFIFELGNILRISLLGFILLEKNGHIASICKILDDSLLDKSKEADLEVKLKDIQLINRDFVLPISKDDANQEW